MAEASSIGSRCPICAGAPRGLGFPYETTWQGRQYRYLTCGTCGSTFVDPLPTSDELAAIYAWSNYHAEHYAEPDLSRYDASLTLLARYRPAARLLDVGCGAGAYLQAARRAGFDPHGVEYEASTIAEAARRSGVPVTSIDTLEASGEQFDVVHLLDVLPHFPDPAAMLRRLERRLRPGGLLFVEGPLENNASLVYFAATAGKRLRRGLGLDRPASIAPTMLVRLNERGQRDFFRRLGYREVYFDVFESGWPYYIAGRRSASPGIAMKQAIGAAAIAISEWQGRRPGRWGNRFMAILELPRG